VIDKEPNGGVNDGHWGVDNEHPTMPGSNPPSATPSNARTVTNDAKLVTNPKHMVKTPQTEVRRGSQTFGDIFLSTRLDGSSLVIHQLSIRRDTAKGLTSQYT
jgi:hypothetical protein